MEEGTLGAQEEDPLGQRAGHPQGFDRSPWHF